MKTCVVIPTYNESGSIARLVEEVRRLNLEVVVIDDGSLDNTSQIAQESGAVVFRNLDNQGKGASLIKGFRYALDKGFSAVITMDGDGQHDPSDIAYFMRLAEYSDNSVFIGNRMSNSKNMPWLRRLTNKLMSWLISKIVKQEIADTQCGFRLIKTEALKKLNLTTSKYETESEILIRASRLGFKIESVPVRTIYHREKSQINPFLDTLRFFRFIIKEVWIMQY